MLLSCGLMNIILFTSYSKEQCAAVISNALRQENSTVVGKIKNDSLSLHLKRNYTTTTLNVTHYAFFPLFKGKLMRQDEGTLLVGKFRFAPVVNYYGSWFVLSTAGTVSFILGVLSLFFPSNGLIGTGWSKVIAILSPCVLWTVMIYLHRLAVKDNHILVNWMMELIKAKKVNDPSI
jgi:hypothetical protein